VAPQNRSLSGIEGLVNQGTFSTQYKKAESLGYLRLPRFPRFAKKSTVSPFYFQIPLFLMSQIRCMEAEPMNGGRL
jgi:hypothetical protein